MTTEVQESQAPQGENKPNDKELNFRNLRDKYEKELLQERNARLEAEKALEKAKLSDRDSEEDSDSEPYVDSKRLDKKLTKFGQNTQSEIQKAMAMAKEAAKEELKQEMWLDSNPDFYEVLQHADKFAASAPELAKTILKMPDSFERQKLVYQNIKHLKIDKPEQKKSDIQERIDSKARGPYYQPTGIGAAPYAAQSDFSAAGQKQAYEKMKEWKARISR